MNIKEALQGTGIELVKPRKQRKAWKRPLNCHGCGRFISWDGRFLNNCRNCGASNCPDPPALPASATAHMKTPPMSAALRVAVHQGV
ncbi:hypothetical protein [Pseudomonas oryzicola]|uniref:hypothetical protein n=1 Tax=Pseudomonas oryzicola TaxID=485876 RepID=UPI001CECBF1D|nr:hypothetical protein [Pseudomonas oryzicola]